MTNFAVFNELSLPFPDSFQNEQIAQKFSIFFGLLKETQQKGLGTLRLNENFKDYEIQKNISFGDFLGQQEREFKSRITSFLTNNTFPLIKNDESEERDNLLESEYFYDENPNTGGLACSDIWDTIAISFQSNERWNRAGICLKKISLYKDEENEIDTKEKKIDTRHASIKEHLLTHQDFFEELEKEEILGITKKNFWEKRKEFFSNIVVFCPEVEAQIQNLDEKIFDQFISKLRKVEKEAKSITEYDWRPESQSVRQNPALRRKREFTIDEKKVFFEKHFNLPSGNRMYFLEKDQKVHIGYIGKHLPTQLYN